MQFHPKAVNKKSFQLSVFLRTTKGEATFRGFMIMAEVRQHLLDKSSFYPMSVLKSPESDKMQMLSFKELQEREENNAVAYK